MKELVKIRNHQQGFTLLESMMALFVLTIGLLGVAAMHSQSMRSGYVAVQRMAAVSKGEELLERMRANSFSVLNYNNAAASFSCTSTLRCLPPQMASDDLFIWGAEVVAAFPGTPVVVVEVLDMADGIDPTDTLSQVTVSIDWSSKGDLYNYTVVTEMLSATKNNP